MAVSYSQLPVMTDAVAADDQIAILDVSAHALKRKDASAMAVVQQDPDTSNSNHEVLLATTDATTQETGTAKKSTNLTFNPSTGNLQATQLNGVTIGNDPKFTDTTYSVVSKTAAGLTPQLPDETTTTKYLRQDGTWSDLGIDPVVISVDEHVLHIN